MGIMDAFKPEDRTEITYSNFYNLIKQAAQYENVMNAVNCNVPHGYIRETMTGKKEEHKEEKPVMGAVNVNFDSEEFKRIMDETIKENFGPDALEEIPADHIQAGTKNRFTGQENARLKKRRGREKRAMTKMNLKFRDFLTLLSPAQHITVQDEDNPLKQGEPDTIFKGKAAKARREEELADREVKMIAPTGDPDLPGTYVFKIWLYK